MLWDRQMLGCTYFLSLSLLSLLSSLWWFSAFGVCESERARRSCVTNVAVCWASHAPYRSLPRLRIHTITNERECVMLLQAVTPAWRSSGRSSPPGTGQFIALVCKDAQSLTVFCIFALTKLEWRWIIQTWRSFFHIIKKLQTHFLWYPAS